MKTKTHFVIIIFSFFCLVKHIANAQAPSWVWATGAGGTEIDEPYSISTDTAGNVFVTGKFNSPSITFGSTILSNAGSSGNDMYLVKYSSSGNVLWATSAGGTSGDAGAGVSADADGNVVVTGVFSSPSITFGTSTLTNTGGGNADIFVVKYDGSGNVLWAKAIGGTGYDEGSAIHTDTVGNVIVTGRFDSPSITFGTTTLTNASAGFSDLFVVKYSPSGNVLWAASAGGPTMDLGIAVSTDGDGNVLVTGRFNSSSITFGTTSLFNAGGNTYDNFVVKYDTSGNVVWATSAGGTSYDDGSGVSTDTSGNVFVTGTFWSPSITFGSTTLTNAGGSDIFVVKYAPSGNVMWAMREGGSNNDGGVGICNDIDGNVFVTGFFYSPSITIGTTTLTCAGLGDIFVMKYDVSGNVLWAKSAGGTESDFGNSITSDAGGNVLVTGFFDSPSINFGSSNLTNADVGYSDIFLANLDNITGTEENIKNNEVRIFPNPAVSSLTVSLANNNIKSIVVITDITGKIIYKNTITDLQNIVVNTKDFAEGIYMVRIQSENFSEAKKLIITK